MGVDNAGKTTVSRAMKGLLETETSPTWGLTQEKVFVGRRAVNLYDVGGGPRIRGIWKRYLAEVHGAVVVVDAADEARLDDARAAVGDHLSDPLLQGKPVLVLANKQDVPGALSPAEVAQRLSLKVGDAVSVVGCIAQGVKGRPDPAVSRGLKWVVGRVGRVPGLRQRVEADAERQMQMEKLKREERKRRVEQQAEADTQEAQGVAGEAGPSPSTAAGVASSSSPDRGVAGSVAGAAGTSSTMEAFVSEDPAPDVAPDASHADAVTAVEPAENVAEEAGEPGAVRGGGGEPGASPAEGAPEAGPDGAVAAPGTARDAGEPRPGLVDGREPGSGGGAPASLEA